MATQTVQVETELCELPNHAKTPVSTAEQDEQDALSATKYDRITILRLLSAGFSFFVAGVNDGSIGALIPYFMREYEINTTTVSSM